MLNRKKPEGKEYEELMKAAISRIQLYSGEWTNFNRSDPGITILENFTAFHALQGSYLDGITEEARERLCAMAGFGRRRGQQSCAYLKAEDNRSPVRLLKNQKLYAGDICYETDQELETGNSYLTGIIREAGGSRDDVTEALTNPLAPGCIYPFGEEPKAGNSLIFILHSLPKPGGKLRLYVKTKNSYPRNVLRSGDEALFADISWSVYTQDGYQEISCRDESGAFLQDGLITLRMPKKRGCKLPGLAEEGYAVKGTLVRAEYDIAPQLASVTGDLFAVMQKDTLALSLSLEERAGGMLRSAMLEGHYLSVYGLEEDGYYHEYYEAAEKEPASGRYFTSEKAEDGVRRFWLKGGQYTGNPKQGGPSAIVVLRSYDIMPNYRLGKVYGYRNQEMKLNPMIPAGQRVIGGECMIMACVKDPGGAEKYRFFRPSQEQPGALKYTVLEEEGTIRIIDAGDYEEAELLLCGLAVFCGEEGNIRADNEFKAVNASQPALKQHIPVYHNPMAAAGGRYLESVRETVRRMEADIHMPSGLVTGEDYEAAVKNMPGLSIHKVKAFAVSGYNEVRVAVKPYSRDRYPVLPAIYRRLLKQEIEKRRMLTVRVKLLSPVYVPVQAKGLIYVKPFHEDCREQVEGVLQKMLDYVSTGHNFGETISFYEIYQALEALDCVEEVCHLSLTPAASPYVSMQGTDIRMQEGALCCPGKMTLEYGRKYTGR